MKVTSMGILLCFLSSVCASASTPAPTEPGSYSRALQQAKRVATMENDHDIPSRAVSLSQRVARNSKLAFKGPDKRATNKRFIRHRN